MDPDDLATILLISPELIDDDMMTFILLADCEEKDEPSHYKYTRFDLNKYNETEFKDYFRFSKEHVLDLIHLLGIKDSYIAKTKIKWSGLEGFCVLLRRLAYPNRLCDLVPMFGRNCTELSIIFNTMLNEIHAKHGHRLETVDQEWVNYDAFAEAVTNKGSILKNVWGFIDGTQGRMCRPHVGQESVFNGHKRIHSLKYQAVIAPNGLIVHFFGPIEGRRHDSALYYLSGIDDLIKDISSTNGETMCIFGDSAYAFRRYLVTPFKGANLTRMQKDFNCNMSSLRACVEWGFGKITNIFAFLAFHKNHKVYLQPIAKYWIVAALLCNCHSCYYGSQTARYFEIFPPSTKDYLS